MERIEVKLIEPQKELLKLVSSKKNYNSVPNEMDRLWELKLNALRESAERGGLKQWIKEERKFMEQRLTEVMEYDELLVRRLIDKVTACDERAEEGLKSGVLISIQR